MDSAQVASLFRLDGDVAMVTGAGAGIGKTAALMLACAGARVVAVDLDEASAGETARAIAEAGGTAIAFSADMGSDAGPAGAVQAATDKFGRLDILVNNAGIYPPGGQLPDIDMQVHSRTYEVNVFGPLRCTAEAAWRMDPGGRIINMSSMESLRPSGPGLSHYSATKAALNAITRASAVDLAERGIRVNAILPGVVRTEGTSGSPPQLFEMIEARAPSRRVGVPDDIAGAVLFLASRASEYVNGHCLVVDGGMTIAG
ncbi:MAG: SDR family oxidoreductase [Novosphingobium sp.]|nr:SDR family oxidoreductase [Novosphingobium sp.]MCP5401564.1 SDR family oxidoreductase [Novosphingobium sp.]